MVNEQDVAITELVESLGYTDSKKLSKWVSYSIKENEKFKEFIIKTKNEKYGKRPEKTLIKIAAKNLVDNLCILYPYKDFFPRSPLGKAYSVYDTFKKGVDPKQLSIEAQKLQEKLSVEKELSEKALKGLSSFFLILKEHSSIDIVSESLRDLMIATSKNTELVDFSDYFQIAAWNDLVELKDKLTEEGESADIYRGIGEKLIELGDATAAIEAIDKAINIDQTDGAAWALKAKLNLDLLRAGKKELVNAAARSETFTSIEHPINSEEHWINERIEDTSSTVEDRHHLFIQSTFAALEHWPRENYWKKGEGDEHRGYRQYAIDSGYSSVNVRRDWLFFHFVLALKKSDFCKGGIESFMKIIRSFQGFDPERYPIPDLILGISVESENKIVFDLKFVEILSLISMETAEVAMDRMIENFRSWKFGAAKHIAILGNSNISKLFWNYLGRDEYIKLYSLCERYDQRNRQQRRLQILCRMQLNSIISLFDNILQIRRKIEEAQYPWAKKEKSDLPTEEQVLTALEVACADAVHFTNGWENFLEDELWTESPYGVNLPEELLSLLFLAPLIDMAHGKVSTQKILSEFVDNSGALKIVIKSLSYPLIDLLFKSIKSDSNKIQDKTINSLYELVGELNDEIEDENFIL